MTEAAVAIRNLTVRAGTHTILDEMTLDIPAGSFTAVIGPNGAGKSTLLHVILGLLAPSGGSVSLFGQLPAAVNRQETGFVPQLKVHDRTFPARPLELVATGLRGRWPWRVRAAEAAQVKAILKRTGAAHLMLRPLNRLSGGELQRVFLARALVRTPRLIVLDEPAAGMDLAGEADMYHILERYQQEHASTVIMVTHDWEGAGLHASHVLLMNRTVLSFGLSSEVLQESTLLHAFGHIGHATATAASRARHA